MIRSEYYRLNETLNSLFFTLKDQAPTREEICVWIYEGKQNGGLQAYIKDLGSAEITPFPSTGWLPNTSLEDCIESLSNMYFLVTDVKSFIPNSRYITGKALLNKWALGLEDEDKAIQLINRYFKSLQNIASDNNEPCLFGLNPGLAEFDRWFSKNALYRVNLIEAIEKAEHIPEPLSVVSESFYCLGMLQDADISKWKESWGGKLGLSFAEAARIIKTAPDDDTILLEKQNYQAEVAAINLSLNLTEIDYLKIPDDLLNLQLCRPNSHKERVKLFVWKFILEEAKFSKPETEYQEQWNQRCRVKIAEIDQLLTENPKLEVDTVAILEGNNKENGIQTKLNNDFEISNLLNIPARVDGWFDVISDMTLAFYQEHGKRPNEAQAWGKLWTSPPRGYSITNSEDKGKEDCLKMPGEKPLSKSAFGKRWSKYTANKP